MKISKSGKKYGFVGIVVLLVSIVAIVAFLRLERQVELHITVPWSGSGLAAIQHSIREFERENPAISVNIQTVPVRDAHTALRDAQTESVSDIAVIGVSSDDPRDIFLLPPHGWTGPTWALYYHRPTLARIYEDTIPASLSDGTASLEEFESMLADILEAGVTPISIGYQYTWPLAAWIQHLALAESGGSPGIPPSSEQHMTEAWQAALDRWAQWEQAGFVYPDARREDWPRSVIRVGNGDAAFVLIAATLATTIPFDRREEVALAPFPRGDHSPWIVGSVWHLAALEHTQHPRQTRRLFEYLTDPATTQRLEQSLNQRFFPRDTRKGADTVVPSLTSDTQSPFIRFIADYRGSWE